MKKKIFIILFLLCLIYPLLRTEALDLKNSIIISERSGKDLLNYPVLIEFKEPFISFDFEEPNVLFFDEKGKELKFWVQEWNVAEKEAKIWVKIPKIEAKKKVRIFYLQKPGIFERGNGNEVFKFFDDFDDGILDEEKWERFIVECDQVECCSWGHCNDCCSNCKNSEMAEEGGFLKIRGTGNCCWCKRGIKSKKVFSDFKIVAKYKDKGICWAWADKWINSFLVGEYRGAGISFTRGEDAWRYGYKLDNQKHKSEVFNKYHDNKWHIIEIEKKGSNWKIKTDGKFERNFSPITNNENRIYFFVSVAEVASGCPGAEVILDWVHVRDYVKVEPKIIFGDDISIVKDSLSVSPQLFGGFLIKGKISSTFVKEIEKVDLAVYDKDPFLADSKEIKRFTIENIKPKGETKFKIKIKPSLKTKELYLVLDPDNKIKEGDKVNNIQKISLPQGFLKTYFPLIKNFLFLTGIFLLGLIFYQIFMALKIKKEQKEIPIKRKHCLKCGMVVDEKIKKCPVCGSEVFEKIEKS